MKYTAAQIAFFVNGLIEGNAEKEVDNLSKIEEGTPGSISFLANPKYTKYIYTTQSSVVLVDKNFKPESKLDCTLIRVDNPYESIAQLLKMVEDQRPKKQGIHPQAFIEDSAHIGSNVYAGPQSYVGNNVKIGNGVKIYPQVFIDDDVVIGDNTTLYSGVKIYNQCKLGANCIIHANTVIGSDGFGFVQPEGSNYNKIPQIGNVEIGNDVEIGSNCSIDRATMGSTLIQDGVKMDNLIQIGHNVEIGKNTIIVAQVGISGSTKIGDNCIIGGQVGIAGHITLANHVKVAAQSGVTKSIKKEGIAVQGTPATPIKDYQRNLVHFRNLSKLVGEFENLKINLDKR